MNFNSNKRNNYDDYNFLFIEKLYNSYISEKDPVESYESGNAFYDLKDLENNIESLFGVCDNIKTSYVYQFTEPKGIKVNEKCFIYKDFIIFIKSKFFRDYAYDYDENSENDANYLQKNKRQLSVNIISNGQTKDLATKFEKLLSKENTKKRKDNELSILCFNQSEGFHLKNVKTLKNEIDLKSNYNDDFLEVSNYILNRLNNKNDKGLVLLHGIPGTGKTNYIRYLTKEIKEKQIIYIPPDFASNISNPDFVTFFLDRPNSILIIEDAENILKSRKSGGNQSVANLLSISDGLLGDGLKLQIICTFNADISEIDEALLREGRLIAEYKFNKLNIEKSQNLLNKVLKNKEINEKIVVNKEMTLAEIFNYKDKRFITKKDNQIGFKRN